MTCLGERGDDNETSLKEKEVIKIWTTVLLLRDARSLRLKWYSLAGSSCNSKFTRTELQVLGNIMFMLNAIRYALTLQLAIVQIDIAVLSGIFSELAAIPTIHILLKDKEFIDEKPPEKTVAYFQL